MAVALARLGHRVSLATQFADDRLGTILAGHLIEAGVRVLRDSTPSARTSSAVADIDDHGVPRYSFDLTWDPALDNVHTPASVVHIGSISTILEPGAGAVLDMVERFRATVTVSYDVNVRPTIMGRPESVVPRVERLVTSSDIVKASDEDLSWLYPGRPVEETAQAWSRLGPAAVVVTGGAEGAACFCSTGAVRVPATTVKVVDTVGAGDTFCAAMLDALQLAGLLGHERRSALRMANGPTWSDVLRHASVAAAVCVAREGADPPSRTELALVRDGRFIDTQ